MTPEQSAAVARLREALLWHNPEASESEFFWRETISNVADPDTIRHLLAALDEAQADEAQADEARPPTNAQITAALDAWFGPGDQPEVRPFGARMRAAINAARAGEKP